MEIFLYAILVVIYVCTELSILRTNYKKQEEVMKKAIILSSGGVDSTTCLSVAVDELGAENVSTASIFYGQKHAKELEAARQVAEFYDVRHYEFDLSQLMKYSDCALLAGSKHEIEHTGYAEQIKKHGEGKVSTYVPFRNGLMLSVAASLAAGLYENEEVDIYIGAHADDAAGNAYADCSEPFLKAMGDAVFIGTYEKVRLVFPFATENKAGVVKRGLQLGTPYELTWSCYEGGEVPCGTCATCRDRQKAFEMNGVKDPACKQV